MIRLLAEAGPWIWPILLLAWVVGGLAVWNLLCLLLRWVEPVERRRRGIDSVLFWGSVAAVLGFLGQWIGIHRMTEAVAARGVVSPQAVAYGISESLLTPVAGMGVLIAAATLWLALRLGLWAIVRRA